jgi:dTDP-4-amino-4,6-dideoxygalactose transaminase
MSSTKKVPSDLAILGGTPAFKQPLHVGRPNIGNRERLFERIEDMLSRRWLSNSGPFVQELERRIAEFLGVNHCIAVCNGTIGLEISIRALGLSGEVIVPSYTFAATAHALDWLGVRPVFCEVSADTHTLDPACVEKLVTPRTSGIIGVHLWGRPCDIASLADIADRHRLQLMFDAAHAFACSYRQRMIGNFGRLEVFSFHATKFFNTFEGGAIVTNDDALAARIRQMKDFGFAATDQVVSTGTNGKMNEVCAAMGLTGLESLDDFIAANRRNYCRYCDGLSGLPGIKVAAFDQTERSNFQYVVVEIDSSVAGITRDSLVQILHRENVLARRYFYPGCHRMSPYREHHPELKLPVSESLSERILTLPTGSAVEVTDVGRICELIGFSLNHHTQINAMLRPGNRMEAAAK